MKWYFCVAALGVIGFHVVEPLHAEETRDSYGRQLIRSLGLTKAQRVALKRLGEPNLAQCFDRLATDERLEADLLPMIMRSVPTADSARPILAFLTSPAGKKFGAAVERREPEFKPALRRPIILPGVVPMSSDELTIGEMREINEFLKSPRGAPLLSILRETSGFDQLA